MNITLHIPELLTEIILSLPIHDILFRARLVNTQWKEIVDKSPSVLRKCYRRKKSPSSIFQCCIHPEPSNVCICSPQMTSTHSQIEGIIGTSKREQKRVKPLEFYPDIWKVMKEFRQVFVDDNMDSWLTNMDARMKEYVMRRPDTTRIMLTSTDKFVDIPHLKSFLLFRDASGFPKRDESTVPVPVPVPVTMFKMYLSIRVDLLTTAHVSATRTVEKMLYVQDRMTAGDLLEYIDGVDCRNIWPELGVHPTVAHWRLLGADRLAVDVVCLGFAVKIQGYSKEQRRCLKIEAEKGKKQRKRGFVR